MHDLAPLTPLGSSAPATEKIGSLKIAEVTDVALASAEARAGDAQALAKAGKSVLGESLPEAGMSSGKGNISAYWIGPGKWLFSAPIETHEDLPAALKSKFGKAASITEQTDGWACFSVESDDLTEFLLRLIQIDVHEMAAGAVRRTMIEHVPVILVFEKPNQTVRILCNRSYGGHLHHALITAAQSVQP